MQTSLQLRSYGYASPYRATGGNPYIQCVRAPQSAFPVEVNPARTTKGIKLSTMCLVMMNMLMFIHKTPVEDADMATPSEKLAQSLAD